MTADDLYRDPFPALDPGLPVAPAPPRRGPAAAILCAEPSCTERIVATPDTQCQGCRGCFCDRHRRCGTFGPDDEPVTVCLDCIGPPEPWGPIA